jgi:hypothetical protein
MSVFFDTKGTFSATYRLGRGVPEEILIEAITDAINKPAIRYNSTQWEFTDDGVNWLPFASGGVTDHGALTGLDDDDHPQYLQQAEADLLYATLGSVITSHGALTGLGNDDHTQYHTDGRAVTWHSGLSGAHVTGGDSHNHAGGDGAQIDHEYLSNLNTSNYSHLTGAEKTDLTDGGDTTLHGHAHSHDHGALTGLSDDDHSQYLTDARHTALAGDHVTNGDSHDHAGGDGAQVDHGSLGGLADDDHSQYLTEARHTALAGDHVTNGDTHDHSGGDGAQIDHGGLGGLADDDHSHYYNAARLDAWFQAKEEIKYPASLTVTYGTLITGAYTDLAAVGGTDVRIDEANSANALQFTMTFTGVTMSPNRFVCFVQYSGGSGHQVAVEFYNHSTAAWDELGVIAHSDAKEWHDFNVYEGANYVNSGTVTVRYRHIQTGVPGHYIILDFVSAQHVLGATGGVGVIEHGSLVGLADDDHLQYHNDSRASTWHGTLAGAHVTNGDSHNHDGGDGAQIDHTKLSNIGTLTHSTLDSYLDQAVKQASSPTFAGLTLTGFSGFVKATAGVLSAAALADSDIPNDITLTNITQITNRSHTNLSDIGTLTHATIDSYLDQSVKQAAAPTFAGLVLSDASNPYITFVRNDSTPSINDVFGTINGYIKDPVNGTLVATANMTFEVDGTTGLADLPSRIIFRTTPDASASLTEVMRLTNAGYLSLMGAPTSFSSSGTPYPLELAMGGTDGTKRLGILVASSSAAADHPELNFFRGRGTTLSSPQVVAAEDNLGMVVFRGHDGTDYENAAAIGVYVDGTPGAGDMPGRIGFFTTPDAGASLAERMRINSDGRTHWKSTGVAHGMTSFWPTDVYGVIGWVSDTTGGLNLTGISDTTNAIPILIQGVSGGTPSSDYPAVLFNALKKSGTSITDLAAAECAFSFENNGTNLIQILGSGTLMVTSTICALSNTGLVTLAGGNTNSAGAQIELYGGAHASYANQAYYDASRHYFRDQDASPTLFSHDGSNFYVNTGSGIITANLYLGGQTSYYWTWDVGNTAYNTNANLVCGANIYWGTKGIWLSSYLDQAVLTTSTPTFGATYLIATNDAPLIMRRNSLGTNLKVWFNVVDSNQRVGWHTLNDNNTYIAVMFYADRSGNFWISNNCSALSFTDRTKYPASTADAYRALLSMEGKNGEVDHSKLDPFVKGAPETIYPKKTKIETDEGGKEKVVMEDDTSKEPTVVETRDLGATISCLVEVVKDLLKRVEALEK